MKGVSSVTVAPMYDEMLERLRASMRNEMALREGALQAQLSALQMQINPHFIYNTLNIISAKGLEVGSLEVSDLCDQFAQMLRYATDLRSRTATLADEVENARRYLGLVKARFEALLEYTIDLPEEAYGLLIPKLTLQPLVENALTQRLRGAQRPPRDRPYRRAGGGDAGSYHPRQRQRL